MQPSCLILPNTVTRYTTWRCKFVTIIGSSAIWAEMPWRGNVIGIHCSSFISGQKILVILHAATDGGQEWGCFTGKKHGVRRKLPKCKGTLQGSVRASTGSQPACAQASQVRCRLVESDITGEAMNEHTRKEWTSRSPGNGSGSGNPRVAASYYLSKLGFGKGSLV